MNNQLVYTSDSIDVQIESYVGYQFNYNNWMVSDNYVYNEKSPRHSSYSIIVTSPIIKNQRELSNYSLFGQELVNKITSLLPLCGLPSLNSPRTHDFLKNRSIIQFESSPNGWKTNYNDIRNQLEGSNGHGIITISLSGGVKGYAVVDESPMKELEVMVKKYDNISEEAKFLIFLNNCILSSVNSNIFMLMGKALEIINAMYPIEGHKDKRIEEYFPELSGIFNGYTIKDLFNWSNNRKETRHYVKDKKDKGKIVSHESLSEEERIMMYKCTTCLIMYVIREQFKLSRPSIIYD